MSQHSATLLQHVQRLERYAGQHYLRPISARDVYRACEIHPTYGAALFRQVRGQTLTDHLTALRISHAQRLLQSMHGRGGAICDIAYASGFRSLSTFYEAFKSRAGKSPRQLLASLPAPLPMVTADDGPTSRGAGSAATVSQSGANGSGGSKRQIWALWVDDAHINLISERRRLADLGIFCDCFATNADAQQALRTASYDLILSDVRRHGTTETGWELAAELARSPTTPPLIFYSGFTNPERRRLARQLHAAAFCTRSDELLKAITRNLP